jgi:hypothetical protein
LNVDGGMPTRCSWVRIVCSRVIVNTVADEGEQATPSEPEP